MVWLCDCLDLVESGGIGRLNEVIVTALIVSESLVLTGLISLHF